MSDNAIPNGTLNRRSILRTIGGTTAVALVGSGTAAAGDADAPYVGISYDTLTHRPQGRAEAEFSYDDDGLVGELRVGGFDVSVGQESPLAPINLRGRPEFVVESSQYERDGQPLKIRFQIGDGGVVGVATRPSGDFGKLGFSLGRADQVPDDVLGSMRQMLVNDGRGVKPKGYDHVPEVPDTGIPTNTGFRNLVRGGEH